MKIALVHDYLTQRGGAERVFELLCKRYPQADIFTSLYAPQHSINLNQRLVKTTFLQNIPGAIKFFRLIAPLYFPAFRALNLQDYDLIISSSSSFAKSVQKRDGARHICFCHNVTRFLWDTETYLREYKDYKLFAPFINKVFAYMRAVDIKYSQGPDLYIANSHIVSKRIQNIYGKPTIVINFPIDTSKFIFSEKKDEYYLAAARMISYKRLDIIVEAFNWLGWRLLISGNGPEKERLQSKALGNIEFLGHTTDDKRAQLFAHAKSIIVTALEDYGLVPIEANASGTPVIAYGKGGVLDTQIPDKTGVLFSRQTPDSLQNALLRGKAINWDYQQIRNHAVANFSEEKFFRTVEQVVTSTCR